MESFLVLADLLTGHELWVFGRARRARKRGNAPHSKRWREIRGPCRIQDLRFMERFHSPRRMHWDREPRIVTSSPTMNTRNRIKVTIKGNDKGFMGRAVVAFAKELAQAAEVSRDSSTKIGPTRTSRRTEDEDKRIRQSSR